MGPIIIKPEYFLCPYCGEWHETYEAEFIEKKSSYGCCRDYDCGLFGCFKIENDMEYIYISIECNADGGIVHGKIPIYSIVEDPNGTILTFDVELTSKSENGKSQCMDCCYRDKCKYNKTFTFKFKYKQSDYDKVSKLIQSIRKEHELQDCNNVVKNNKCFMQKCEDVSKKQKPENEKNNEQATKEDAIMANNIFNMNMEFGPNKDENLVSTIMGIAVKNGDSWRIYDEKKNEITDIGNIQFGNLPIFIMPTTKLNKGDLVKYDGNYYFIIKSEKGNNNYQFIDVKTGEIKEIIPTNNIFGFNCYSKVIAFNDSINMGDDLSFKKLACLSAMCGQTNENDNQMNQLLPAILLKDKFNDDDEMMQLMLMFSMLSSQGKNDEQNVDMNMMLPFMLIKEENADNDMINKIIMYSMMSSGNPLNFLMLDKFMKNEGKHTDENPNQ